MRIDVLTLFPEMFEGVFSASILGKARDKGIVRLNTVNFRDYANNKHNTVDDYPYGGGGGMVLKPEPIFAAVEHLLEQTRKGSLEGGLQSPAPVRPEGSGTAADGSRSDVQANGGGAAAGGSAANVQNDDGAAAGRPGAGAALSSLAESGKSHSGAAASRPGGASRPRIILMCPQGETFSQKKAEELAREEHLVFICGHYEGYDERIREHLVTDELSIGDYVLTGGELPAMVAIDSIVRLLPGVLGNEMSAVTDSFSTGLLEYPHYTRPVNFRGWEVPEILLSGHHKQIAEWRKRQSLLRTLRKRPELLDNYPLTDQERRWLDEEKRCEQQAGGGSGKGENGRRAESELS